MDVYKNILRKLEAAKAVDEAQKRLMEADRDPDVYRRFVRRGAALKELEKAQRIFLGRMRADDNNEDF